MEEQFYIWFNDFLNVNSKVKYLLFNKYKSPKVIYNLNEKQLKDFIESINSLNINFNKELFINSFSKSKKKYTLDFLTKLHKKNISTNINTINVNNENYLNKLRNIYDYPFNLYYKGKNINILNGGEKVVAIVGSRKATNDGLKSSYDIAYNLSKEGVIVVSGMADGIDSFAHAGALAAKGKTIAILGCGLDICYPSKNQNLMDSIIRNGLVLSEYYLGTKPYKENFPKRNRIISALADFVLIIEAKEKSGSLITATYALEQGKDVGAVPGSIYSEFSKGTNALIKDGAYLIRDANDILDILH